MIKPKICLTLTGKTLEEDAEFVKKYSQHIDIAELRVDYLNEEERLNVRRFPAMINIPCILTIRRLEDGGLYNSGEFSRTALFGRALAFADQNPSKNFAYVDFEEDFHVPGLLDSVQAFGVKIIRSCHKFDGPVVNLRQKCLSMRRTPFEIPKIAFMPNCLDDVTRLFREAGTCTDFDHIFVAMGNLGLPSRILSYKLGSMLTFTSPLETSTHTSGIGHLDPITLNEMYNFRNLDENTRIFAVTGFPLKVTSSPLIHNEGYREHGMNNVFIPLCSSSMAESFDFADELGIKGMAVTVPYKKDAMELADEVDSEVAEIGACNTVVKGFSQWVGHNTDAGGFREALVEFIGDRKLRRRKVAIIGAGGAAKAIAYTIKEMGGKACIFNRTESHARSLAEQFGFEYAVLEPESANLLDRYSDIIIQTTKVGMNSEDIPNKDNNPIWFYNFKGHEYLYDIVYDPQITPVMQVAKQAGCKVCNGYSMLKYQGYRQFKYFTGVGYDEELKPE